MDAKEPRDGQKTARFLIIKLLAGRCIKITLLISVATFLD